MENRPWIDVHTPSVVYDDVNVRRVSREVWGEPQGSRGGGELKTRSYIPVPDSSGGDAIEYEQAC